MSTAARRCKKFRIPTPDYLANSALYYLSRYAASEASLRRVLENKIRRAAMQNQEFASDHEALVKLRATIDQIVETHKRTGVINDAAFAEMKVNSLRRSGRSAKMINQKLAQKGLATTVINKALVEHDEEASPREADIKAAHAFAKRRCLGPYRKPSLAGSSDDFDAEKKRKAKEITTLARAGFAFDIVKEVLGSDGVEDFDL